MPTATSFLATTTYMMLRLKHSQAVKACKKQSQFSFGISEQLLGASDYRPCMHTSCHERRPPWTSQHV